MASRARRVRIRSPDRALTGRRFNVTMVISPKTLPASPLYPVLSLRSVSVNHPLILLVEDDPESRDGYAEFLERGGFRVTKSANAEDAIAAIGEIVPDAIVTDISLPGKDGFVLAQAVREHPRARRVPLLAMTAYWAADLHDRAERAGINATLLKPCQPEHLIAELNRVLQQSRTHTSRPEPVAHRSTFDL
jgi:CheY-like chemotaxis protein